MERRRTTTATGLYDSFCHIVFFLHSFSFICVSKSLNDAWNEEATASSCLIVATGLKFQSRFCNCRPKFSLPGLRAVASPGFCVRGAQVCRREKTENNKCMSYHPRQHCILVSMRYCISPVCYSHTIIK